MNTYICIYTCICIYVYVYIYIYKYMYMCICIHVYISIESGLAKETASDSLFCELMCCSALQHDAVC